MVEPEELHDHSPIAPHVHLVKRRKIELVRRVMSKHDRRAASEMPRGQMRCERSHFIGPVAKIAIGRVKKEQRRRVTYLWIRKQAEQIVRDYDGPILNFQRVYIRPQSLSGAAIGFEKRHAIRPTTQTFQAHASGAGKAIVNNRPRNQRRKDVEDRLLHTIGHGACRVRRRRKQPATTKFSGNDAHDV